MDNGPEGIEIDGEADDDVGLLLVCVPAESSIAWQGRGEGEEVEPQSDEQETTQEPHTTSSPLQHQSKGFYVVVFCPFFLSLSLSAVVVCLWALQFYPITSSVLVVCVSVFSLIVVVVDAKLGTADGTLKSKTQHDLPDLWFILSPPRIQRRRYL